MSKQSKLARAAFENSNPVGCDLNQMSVRDNHAMPKQRTKKSRNARRRMGAEPN